MECQFNKTESECKAGDTCLFPHHKVTDNRTKSQKQATFPARRGCGDKNAVTIVKTVPQLFASRTIRKHWFLKNENIPGETRCKKSLGTDSKSTIHSVYATPSKYPEQQRIISWENTSQNYSPAKSVRYEI